MVDHRYDPLPGETSEEHAKRVIIVNKRIRDEEKAAKEASRAKISATGTVTVSNDPKLNISTGINKLQETNKNKEGNMVNELEPTEIDAIKHEKIEKQKKFQENVNNAINIAAELRGDIKKIKEELCEGPDCLKNQVANKFGEIDDKIKKIDEKTQFFVCEKCSYPNVPALASFCPQCGNGIYEWTDDDGQPIPGWKHYSEK
jgi:hypothetical protein